MNYTKEWRWILHTALVYFHNIRELARLSIQPSLSVYCRVKIFKASFQIDHNNILFAAFMRPQ